MGVRYYVGFRCGCSYAYVIACVMLQDHYNDFDDNALDSPGQHFCVEDGHIIYDASPTDAAVVYNASASSGIAGASAAADRTQPASSRWSPATATTTITAMDDDDSSSSKHCVIIYTFFFFFFS